MLICCGAVANVHSMSREFPEIREPQQGRLLICHATGCTHLMMTHIGLRCFLCRDNACRRFANTAPRIPGYAGRRVAPRASLLRRTASHLARMAARTAALPTPCTCRHGPPRAPSAACCPWSSAGPLVEGKKHERLVVVVGGWVWSRGAVWTTILRQANITVYAGVMHPPGRCVSVDSGHCELLRVCARSTSCVWPNTATESAAAVAAQQAVFLT